MIKGHLVDIKHSVYSEDVHVCTFFICIVKPFLQQVHVDSYNYDIY